MELLVYGFFEHRKDYYAIIDSLDFLPEFTLRICGSIHNGREFRLKELINRVRETPRASLSVGFFPKKEIFQNAWALVVPYTTAYGMSGVVSDAIGHGIPFLLTDIPPFREIFDCYPFRLRFPWTAKTIAEDIESLRDHYEEALCCLDTLRNKMSWRRVAELYYELY